MKNIEPIDLIIPSFNNPDLLNQCISSIASLRLYYPCRIIIVNNGHPNSLAGIPDLPYLDIVQTGGANLGWEGGLKKGLERSKSEFVGFLNDDIYIPSASAHWLRQLMSTFHAPEVAAVGPSTNMVMGPQNIWKGIVHQMIETTFLIGFCMLLRRKALDEVGGVDDTLPGGDDLDLSIRLRSAGYKLVARRDVFVFHHGFVTGTRLFGGETKKGGWNSREMTERTDRALVLKHGFRKWFECRAGLDYPGLRKGKDFEGDIVRGMIVGEAVADLGCGNNKTVPWANGVDIVSPGKPIPNLNGVSEADIVADVEDGLPFPEASQDTIIARHILEHCVDFIAVIKKWRLCLKPGGRLIVAVPDEKVVRGISMNPEHVHAFTAESLKSLLELCGFKAVAEQPSDSCSIVVAFEKMDEEVVNAERLDGKEALVGQ